MTLYLEIIADTNDADYIRIRSIIDENTLKTLMPLINAIKNCKVEHNWNTSDYRMNELSPREMYKEFSEDIIEHFSNYVPYGEYGIHTIVDISLIEVISEKSLLRD